MGLQWGHASSRVETKQGDDRRQGDDRASMGPRVFTRGNVAGFWFKPETTNRFNGATRLHAWKRAGSRAGRPTLKTLQWGHASSRVETFVGESAIEPHAALQWGHASSRVETRCLAGEHRAPYSFNGATRLHAWKRVTAPAARRVTAGLQWGHASSRVETRLSSKAGR